MNDDVRLVPLGHEHLAGMEAITGDPGALRFTRVPEPPPAGFAQSWIQRYLDGRASGEREAYAIVDGDGAFLGAGMIPTMDAESLTAELGYIVVSSARGRGVATRGLALLTDRALELGMKRIELWIAVANPASQKVAERCGFRLEGVMRSAYHKQGLREDTQAWSLLDTDPRPAL